MLEQRPELAWPATLYLEGSDQHRGWFHSSLLESCGTRGRAPYDAVLTHGFVVDEHGRKMSKSLGNVVSPLDLMKTRGADILRLWAVGADYAEDLRIGDEILAGQADAYRRLRNTLRYLLGSLAGFSPSERLPDAEMPELERWVLHRLAELDGWCARPTRTSTSRGSIRRCTISARPTCRRSTSTSARTRSTATGPTAAGGAPRAPCSTGCSTASPPGSRRSWCSPTEEAWLTPSSGRPAAASICGSSPSCRPRWRDPALGASWERIRRVRRVITGALEVERQEKRIGSSLEAAPEVYLGAADAEALAGLDLAELAITSELELTVGAAAGRRLHAADVPGVGGRARSAPTARKCARCWRVLPGGRGRPRRAGPLSALPGRGRRPGRRLSRPGRPHMLRRGLAGRAASPWRSISSPNGLALERLDAGGPPLQVTPFFNLVLVWNRGVSFGMFNSGGAFAPWLLSGLALAVVVGLSSGSGAATSR